MQPPSSDLDVRRFPDGFLFGCATAAHQVEGGLDDDWTEMEETHPERIKDGSVSGIACDQYHRYADDIADLAALGNNAYRFSVDWSRVEPGEGHFDLAALDHYREVVRECHRAGLEPIVTLFHFTLPRWLARKGGVLAPDAPRLFARFAAACAAALVDEVTWWVTINEPNVYATFNYSYGCWPASQQSFRSAMRANRGMLLMHASATTALRHVAEQHVRRVQISIAHHERRLLPSRARDRLFTPIPDLLFNRWFLRCCRIGRILPPAGRGEPVPGLRGSLDYVGVNWYCDELMRFDGGARNSFFISPVVDDGRPRTELGWLNEPVRLRRVLHDLWRELQLPLLITENGVADRTDAVRPTYIIEHLHAVLDAIYDGVDVRGYLHWTSMDNFEWLEGFGAHFGLFVVDRATLQRTKRPSADVYAQICRTGALPEPANAR